ncbi:hypothetical protein [Prevotella fusca]|uniref:Uncharacterized protein n=1 Tax=Prevotella fusca JCM 17724 TaxID=1236517 RepID=A0A0K1NK81_9BACT|nr:hypothetical protein [Prevotella fusca]AKU69081.1 hypothetical protein ADJ77_04455 [Prevotella fusca JCM 17724]QUB86707.1 hypothetical protein J5A51_11575 [Prevotella fusca JCM 17724]
MKKKFRTIIEELGQKTHVRKELASDLERLSGRLALHHIHLESASLKKLIGYFTGKEKPSKKTLDRLALFAGFQNWKDLNAALHGESDAKLNYED